MAFLTEENATEYLPLLTIDRNEQLRTVIDADCYADRHETGHCCADLHETSHGCNFPPPLVVGVSACPLSPPCRRPSRLLPTLLRTSEP